MAVCLGLLFTGIVFHAKSQFIYNNRPAFWPSLGIQKNVGERCRLKLEHSTRLRFAPFMMDKIYILGGVEYKIRWNIALEAGYRFAWDYTPRRQFMPEHRISLEADFKTNRKRWNFVFHPGVQTVFSRENLMENSNPLWAFRPRFQIDYNLAKTSLNPFGSVELFIGRLPEHSFDLYKYRVTLGASYKLTKQLRLDVFLRQQGGWNNTEIMAYSILGTELTWRIN